MHVSLLTLSTNKQFQNSINDIYKDYGTITVLETIISEDHVYLNLRYVIPLECIYINS